MARSERSVEKEADWRAKLDEQRQSGLGVRAFCRAKSISEPSFYAWRRALAARDAENTATARQKTAVGREKAAAKRERTADSRGKQRLIPVEIVSAQRESASSSDAAQRNSISFSGIAGNQRLEIVTPGGFTLRFAADTSSETLARLLDIVAQHALRCAAEGTSAC